MSPNLMTSPSSYTIFEAINNKRHEIYAGMTRRAMHETIAELRRKPPIGMKEWDFSDVNFRSIEFDLNETDAKTFLDTYVKTRLPKGWRFVNPD